jgi:hypothetical protein
LPTAAGTDAMANYSSLRGPVGLNRVYVHVPKGPLKIAPWLNALQQGRTLATNGPLLGFTLDRKEPGDTVRLPAGDNQVKLSAWMRSLVPIDHLELICNGKPARVLELHSDRQSADAESSISISESGWCLLRAFSDKPEYPLLDLYPYATTSPVYIEVAGSAPNRQNDAAYFEAWIDRMAEAAKSNHDWNNEAEKSDVLEQLSRAHKIYEGLGRGHQ